MIVVQIFLNTILLHCD